VRCRPLNSKEKADGRKQIVETFAQEGQIRVRNPKGASDAVKVFTYDQVYGSDSEQLEVFSVTAKPIVESVLAGYNGTIFAYGQTGTGAPLEPPPPPLRACCLKRHLTRPFRSISVRHCAALCHITCSCPTL
jgi:Kinesin motor domain